MRATATAERPRSKTPSLHRCEPRVLESVRGSQPLRRIQHPGSGAPRWHPSDQSAFQFLPVAIATQRTAMTRTNARRERTSTTRVSRTTTESQTARCLRYAREERRDGKPDKPIQQKSREMRYTGGVDKV